MHPIYLILPAQYDTWTCIGLKILPLSIVKNKLFEKLPKPIQNQNTTVYDLAT